MTASPEPAARAQPPHEPVGERRPGVIYGARQPRRERRRFRPRRASRSPPTGRPGRDHRRSPTTGQGMPADVMDALASPTSRPGRARPRGQIKDGEPSGLGLGFFIAKTLLERSGATVILDNRARPATGAVVGSAGRATAFESQQAAPRPSPSAAPRPWREPGKSGIGRLSLIKARVLGRSREPAILASWRHRVAKKILHSGRTSCRKIARSILVDDDRAFLQRLARAMETARLRGARRPTRWPRAWT